MTIEQAREIVIAAQVALPTTAAGMATLRVAIALLAGNGMKVS